jgi:hypothetical protein
MKQQIENVTLSVKAARAVHAYGLELCRRAYAMHREGNGARTVGFEYGLTTRQADAAIDAGREYQIFTTGKE